VDDGTPSRPAGDAAGTRLIETLHEFYGLQPTPPAELFQFFVWEILSEQALPARRDLAWQALRRLPALTPDAMFRVPAKDLLEVVGTAGPHREEKVERMRAVVGEFKRHRDLLSAEAFTRLGTLGVARALRRLEHASSAARARALLFAAGRTLLPIDEDANRVISRLMGAPDNRRGARARRWLSERLRPELATYRDAIIYIRHHALQTCVKVAPHCSVCPLRHDCPSH
jgi:endonuclease III